MAKTSVLLALALEQQDCLHGTGQAVFPLLAGPPPQ